MRADYIGRFAPSPTGPLHAGSLAAALVSYLDAKAHGGEWHIRIDDIDTTRCISGAGQQILQSLHTHGLHWDGDVLYQTRHYPHYRNALAQLQSSGLIYPCDCPRKRTLGRQYDRYCLSKAEPITTPYALRFKMPTADYHFDDLWQGHIAPNPLDDMIVWRKDQLCAYQLAVVVDDHQLGVNHVIRGADLLPPTLSQLALYQALNYTTPQYGHFPVLLDINGNKLSKQNHAPAIDNASACGNIRHVLSVLGQAPLSQHHQSPSSLLQQAIDQWDRSAIPTQNIPWDHKSHPISLKG